MVSLSAGDEENDHLFEMSNGAATGIHAARWPLWVRIDWSYRQVAIRFVECHCFSEAQLLSVVTVHDIFTLLFSALYSGPSRSSRIQDIALLHVI